MTELATQKLRVLVVDDSATIRKQVARLLKSDSEIEVAGEAEDGILALEKIALLNPDVVILDVEMPNMDGLATLKAIRERNAKLPVIMFSTLTQKAATTTLDALALGANDYVPKPTSVGTDQIAVEEVREQLVTKIKGLCRSRGHRGETNGTSESQGLSQFRAPSRLPVTTHYRKHGVDIIVIGASTGGPNVITSILERIPPEFSLPIAIVQHMPPLFTRLLAERLTATSKILVREAKTGDSIAAPGAWIAPGGSHLKLNVRQGGVFADISADPPENSCRPAVDVLFRSAARAFGPRVLAVVLTGMGKDGTEGAKAICDRGGAVIVQDEESSVVWSMPGSVVKAGLAAKVLPVDKISDEIIFAARKAPKTQARC